MTNTELILNIQNDQNRQQNIELLYQANTGLLKKICNTLSKATGYEFDDLLQQSFFGLVKAAETFKADQDIEFSTYASTVIKRDLQRYINETGFLIRKPDNKQSLIWKYNHFLTEYRMKNNTDPFDQEVCDSLQISSKQLERLKADILSTEIRSLSETVSDAHSGTISDALPDPVDRYEKIEGIILNDQLAVKIWNAVNSLKERQKKIIKEYYASDSTLEDIAARSALPVHTVRRERDKALKELKNKYRKDLLPFYEVYSIGIKKTSFAYWKRTGTSATEHAVFKLLEREKNEHNK